MSDPVSGLDVLVDPESIRRMGGTGETGRLWIGFGARGFPEEGWNDFVVVVLRCLCAGVDELVRGTSVRVVVRFMDGPFAVVAERTAGGGVSLAGIRDTGSPAMICEGTDDLRAFAKRVRRSASLVLQTCADLGWQGPDLDALQDANLRLQNTLRNGSTD